MEIYILIIVFSLIAFNLLRLALVITTYESYFRMATFAAMVLVLISGVYIGFALTVRSSMSSYLDIILASGFMIIAFIALTKRACMALKLLAIAFASHAAIDTLHSVGVLQINTIPHWYINACAVYDISIAMIIWYGHSKAKYITNN